MMIAMHAVTYCSVHPSDVAHFPHYLMAVAISKANVPN